MEAQLPALPSEFRKTALAFPSRVKSAIAKLSNVKDAVEGLAQAEVIATYASRIKATTEEVNSIQYGKLLLAAKVGELCPAEVGGRGKKGVKSVNAFSNPTMADYRKLAKHHADGRIDDYWQAVADDGHESEMSIAGCLRFVSGVHVSHNSGCNEWYTPPDYAAAAKNVMGGIDCDPASSEVANETIGADTFYTVDDDGLTQDWGERVWLNPPYSQPAISNFADAIASKYESGEVKEACVLVNNATETEWFRKILSQSAAVCFIAGRVKFLDPSGKASGAPLQGQAILYLGRKAEKFATEFASFGEILWRREG